MQPHYIGHLELDPLPDGRNWRTEHTFGLWTPAMGLVSVPSGFKTDLASVPQIFWNILPPFGKYSEAAVIHDYCYRTHLVSRAVADGLLRTGMILCRVPRWQRFVIYWAVRIFGGHAYADGKRRISFLSHRHD